MTRLFIRCDKTLKDAAFAVADAYDCDLSAIMRGKLREVVREEKDAIPTDVYVAANIGSIKDGEKPFQQAMHLPNNLFEQTRELLKKRFPPHPEEVQERYYEPYKEIIEMVYDEPRQSRKVAQMDYVLRTYRRLHPDTKSDNQQHVLDAVVDMAVSIKIEEDMETARQFVKGMIKDGVLRDEHRDSAFDMVREMSRDEWQAEWKEAMQGWS